MIPASPAQKPPEELEIQADRQGLDLIANRFVAIGNVKLTLSGGRLLADRLEYDASTRTLYLNGRIRFQRGSHYLQASRLRYSLIENSGELEEVYGVMDLDNAALDLNPSQPPTAPLLPLSYWDRLRAPFNEPLQLRSAAAIPPPSPLKANGSRTATAEVLGERIAAALQLEPLTDQPQDTANGTPQRVPDHQWRMPPVALSPAAQTMACPPALPPIPDWHPHPWSATIWGGQMYTANFGGTFTFDGRYRPEYLAGIGLQRRLVQGGPLSLELDGNLFAHLARSQPGGEFNQSIPFSNTPSQTFGEATVGLGARLWLQPWLNVFFEEGVSLLSEASNWEKTEREKYAQFLNYLAFEVEGLVSPQWSLVWRIHHRSGAYGTYSGVSEGSNAYLLGLRYRYGTSPVPRIGIAMAPPSGCPDLDGQPRVRPQTLAEQLNSVTAGPSQAALSSPTAVAELPRPRNNPQAEEARRNEALRGLVDQRVQGLQHQGSLSAERRAGITVRYEDPGEVNTFGDARPQQLQSRITSDNKELVKGTISRWRFQANTLTITPSGWAGDRVAFTNDPYTPSQSWVDAIQVRAKLKANGDLEIKSARTQVILEDRLPLPLRNNLLIEKEKEVDNPWVLANDQRDRNGDYIGYNLRPITFGKDSQGKLLLQPQFMVRRALNGTTNSYTLPGESAGAPPESQPARVGDFFGLLATVQSPTPLLGLRLSATLDSSTLDPTNFTNGTRSWGDLSKIFNLPVVGDINTRIFAAYRYRVWNGSLGEQDIYSAFGALLEKQGNLPSVGKLSSNYLLRAGAGNFQSNDFNSTNFADLWRANIYGSINATYPIWTGKALPEGPQGANRYSAVPIIPGLTLNANSQLNLSAYGDGTRQYAVSLSGGPTLTLGHFNRNAFDWTQFTITGGGTIRQGESPFSFDRIVDLGTLGLGLTQQLFGPLVMSGGIGLNVDPNSQYYGDITNSYVEIRWQRRSYELAVYYSPYEQIGGIRVKLNDFNFRGTGIPFVPYNPASLDASHRRPAF